MTVIIEALIALNGEYVAILKGRQYEVHSEAADAG